MNKWILRNLVLFIKNCLPSKGKRMICLVMCYILWSKTKDDKTLRNECIEINNRLHFSDSNRAILFTIDLCQILKNLAVFKRLSNINQQTLKEALPRAVPFWLRYDTRETISEEIGCILKERYIHG